MNDNLINTPKVAVVILNWNGKYDTCECIESVQKLDYQSYTIIIVDNGSEDDSVQFLKQKYSDILIIENGTNHGYAGGNNSGIEYAIEQKFDYILLLNNDAVVDPQMLNSFVNVSRTHPNAGVFGAKIYYLSEPLKIWFAGGKILPSLVTAHEGIEEIDDGVSCEEVRSIDYACGCALFFKSDVVRTIGLLESKFFLIWEEVDFCCRARRAGFECLFVPKALVWHKISSSFKGGDGGYLQQYFWVRNRLLWIERNTDLITRLTFYKQVFLSDFNYYIRGYLSPKSDSKHRIKSQVSLIAVRDYFFRKFGDCPNWIRSI